MIEIKYSVIIPSYNEEQYIKYCLESLMRQSVDRAEFEVILVDNESTDNTIKIASEFDVKIITSSAKYVGGVRNDGARIASGEYLLFVDSDCVVDSDWVLRSVDILKNSGKSAVGGLCLLKENPSFFERYWGLPSKSKGVVDGTLVGGCICVSRLAFLAVGGFPDNLTAGEDTEFSYRLIAIDGYTLHTGISVIHLGYPNTLKGFFSRQVWQSSSYSQNFSKAVTSFAFLLTLLHFSTLVYCIFRLASFKGLGLFNLIAILVIPAIFSGKRVLRARYIDKYLYRYLFIYVIDWIYLVAREYGIISSTLAKVLSRNSRIASSRSDK